MFKGYKLIGIYLLVVLAAVVWLCSCKSTEYVPLPEYHTEIVHHWDTIKKTDTLRKETNTILREARPEDSAMIAQLGLQLKENERLLILTRQELKEQKSQAYESHGKDSVRVDSIPVPYHVEHKLNKWEQFKMDYGAIAIGGTAVAVILTIILLIVWIRRKGK